MTKSGQSIFKPALAKDFLQKKTTLNKMFKDKTAVLTGSSRGIGKEILSLLAKNNVNVIACSKNRDESFKFY